MTNNKKGKKKYYREISSLAHTQELVRPFGAGRRSCVGRRLAEQAILVALNRYHSSFFVLYVLEL